MNTNKDLITRAHKIIELLSWCILAAIFAIAIYGNITLPDEIATHFGANGLPDGYGSPKTLLITPFIVLALLLLMSLVAHGVKPQNWSIPFQLTESNKTKVYQAILDMYFSIELECVVFFLFIIYEQLHQRGTRILPVMCIWLPILFMTLIIMFIRAKKANYKFDM